MNLSKNIAYHYYLFEFGNTGYLLDSIKGYTKNKKAVLKYDAYLSLIISYETKGFYSQEIIDVLLYKRKYTLDTHKAKINPWQKKAYPLQLYNSTSKKNDNILYCFFTQYEIKNFAKMNRYHASRYVVYPDIFYQSEGEDMPVELYLN